MAHMNQEKKKKIAAALKPSLHVRAPLPSLDFDETPTSTLPATEGKDNAAT